MQELRQSGLATGEVASCRITHATPAAFYAHQINRGMDAEILSDLYKYGPDVFVAGGNKLLVADSLTQAGYQVTYSLDSMAAIASGKVACILAEEDMPTAPFRGDTIRKGVEQAIRLLEKDEDGFFLFIEGSQIDWAGHGNEGERLRAEMQDINRVIGYCMDYADTHPGTLVFVTADHETGGLSLPGEEMSTVFTTGQHSGVMVPFYAYGTGAEQLKGVHENTDFKALLLSLKQKK
jgi:alkaline phosphatase